MLTRKAPFTPDVLAKNVVKYFIDQRKDCIYIRDLILQLQQIQNNYSNQPILTVLYQRLTGNQQALLELAGLICELQRIINSAAYDINFQISVLKIMAKYLLSNDASATGNQLHGLVIKLIIDNNGATEEISLDNIQTILAMDGGKIFKDELDSQVKSTIYMVENNERIELEKNDSEASDESYMSEHSKIISDILRDESPVSQQLETPVHNLNRTQNFLNMLGFNFGLGEGKDSDDDEEEEVIYSRHRLSF